MRKSKPQVLDEFIQHLFKSDPKGICYPDNPDKETEYDGEALSILSRFVESHLVAATREDALHIAYVIVQGAFTFWFTGPLSDEDSARKLAQELLDIYLALYPEQGVPSEVVSGDEERVGDGSSGLPGIPPGETPPGSG